MEHAIIYVLILLLSVVNVLSYRKMKNIEKNMEMEIANKNGIFYNILMKLREFSASDYIKGKPFLLPDILLEAEKRGYFKKNAIINRHYQFSCIENLTSNEIEVLCKMRENRFGIGDHVIIHIYNNGLWADIEFEGETETFKSDAEKLYEQQANGKTLSDENIEKFGFTTQELELVQLRSECFLKDKKRKYPVAVFANTKKEAIHLAAENGLDYTDKKSCCIITHAEEINSKIFSGVLVGDISNMNARLIGAMMIVSKTQIEN